MKLLIWVISIPLTFKLVVLV